MERRAEGRRMNDADANQAYGASTAEFYLAGFTFERAMARTLRLLKKGDWRKVGDGFDDVNDFVRSLQLDRFKLLADQRKEFVEQVKKLQPTVSNRAISEALGVSDQTINNDAKKLAPSAGNAKGNGNVGAKKLASAGGGKHDAARIHQRDTREERREEKLMNIAMAAELKGQFSVIYADPPWEDEFGPTDRQTELHYPLMTLEAIKAVPVDQICTPDAVLCLWALPHMVPAALEVMAKWGFDYRTDLVWVKDNIGLGEWVRQQHENLLIGRRGAFPPPPTAVRSSSMVFAPRGKHSAKPDVFAEMIERWYPESVKVELFRRGAPRPGWAAWGNEAKAAE
jgi:N6-adenosine-specific RNA methylase IME4